MSSDRGELPGILAGAAAARWLKLAVSERENAGLMAPIHDLREEINVVIRERLIRDGTITGPTMETERLISLGYTRAEKALAANYAAIASTAMSLVMRVIVVCGTVLRTALLRHGWFPVDVGHDG